MPESNINNFPVIKEKSLHRIVERVKNNDDTLLRDSKTGKDVKTSDYLGVNVDEQGKVTGIRAKQPFYWGCWDFEEDIERKDMNEPIKKDTKKVVRAEEFPKDFPKDFVLDKRKENEGGIFVQYDFAIDFSWIEIGSVGNPFDDSRIYFSKLVRFNSATFSNIAFFNSATFSNRASFESATFSSEAHFESATFSSEAFFNSAIFSNKASFQRATFSSEAHFLGAIFSSEVLFDGATFSNTASFWSATFSNKASFQGAVFSYTVVMADLRFTSGELFIDFGRCTIESNIVFGFSDDSADSYKKLIFSLYCSNINYFICDDTMLKRIRLYGHNPTKEDVKEWGKKTITECYIHELRVMRKIFQDLLWGDVADEYYAKIMNAQIKLDLYEIWRDYPTFLISMRELFKKQSYKNDKRLSSKKPDYLRGLFSKKTLLTFLILLKVGVFRYGFGWGVRLGYIFRTGFLTIVAFSLFYFYWPQNINYYVGHDVIPENTQDFFYYAFLFSIWNFFNIFLPDMQSIALNSSFAIISVTTEAILGIIWMTLLVAILTRKFMRL